MARRQVEGPLTPKDLYEVLHKSQCGCDDLIDDLWKEFKEGYIDLDASLDFATITALCRRLNKTIRAAGFLAEGKDPDSD